MVKVEGQVTISVSELDNLREQIKTLTEQKQQLEQHSMEVKITNRVDQFKFDPAKSMYRSPSYDRYGHRYGSSYDPDEYKSWQTVANDVQYVGLDAVKAGLKQEAEDAVIAKIGDLERQIKTLKEKEQEILTNHMDEMKNLQEQAKEKFNQQKDTYEQMLKEKQATIDELNGVVADKTKDQIISDLRREIENLKLKKGFWGFLHS